MWKYFFVYYFMVFVYSRSQHKLNFMATIQHLKLPRMVVYSEWLTLFLPFTRSWTSNSLGVFEAKKVNILSSLFFLLTWQLFKKYNNPFLDKSCFMNPGGWPTTPQVLSQCTFWASKLCACLSACVFESEQRLNFISVVIKSLKSKLLLYQVSKVVNSSFPPGIPTNSFF